MFEFLFGSPVKKLKKKHAVLMEQAMQAQRSGNIALYAKLSSEADELYKKIIEMEKPQ
jgi:hypothetical protein